MLCPFLKKGILRNILILFAEKQFLKLKLYKIAISILLEIFLLSLKLLYLLVQDLFAKGMNKKKNCLHSYFKRTN